MCVQAWARGARDNLTTVLVHIRDAPIHVRIPDWLGEVEGISAASTVGSPDLLSPRTSSNPSLDGSSADSASTDSAAHAVIF